MTRKNLTEDGGFWQFRRRFVTVLKMTISTPNLLFKNVINLILCISYYNLIFFQTLASEEKGKVIIAAMDVNQPENAPVSRKYNITGFPTLLYFDKAFIALAIILKENSFSTFKGVHNGQLIESCYNRTFDFKLCMIILLYNL